MSSGRTSVSLPPSSRIDTKLPMVSMNTRVTPAPTPSMLSGRITWRNRDHHPAPSTAAVSSRLSGMPSITLARVRIMNGRSTWGSATTTPNQLYINGNGRSTSPSACSSVFTVPARARGTGSRRASPRTAGRRTPAGRRGAASAGARAFPLGADLPGPRLHPLRTQPRQLLPRHLDPVLEAPVQRGGILLLARRGWVVVVLMGHVVAGEVLVPQRLVLRVGGAVEILPGGVRPVLDLHEADGQHGTPGRRQRELDVPVAGRLHAERAPVRPRGDVDLAAGQRRARLRVAGPELRDVRLHLAQAADDGRRIGEAPAQLAVDQPRDGQPIRRRQVRIEDGAAPVPFHRKWAGGPRAGGAPPPVFRL